MRAKKYVFVYAAAVFLIVFLITFNTVCAITQFDVRYDVGSVKMTQAAQNVQNSLEKKYLHKSYLFFKDSAVREVVAEEGKGYLEITDISRSFPNKITVSVRERFENYAFVKEENGLRAYYTVGDDGTVLAVSDKNESYVFGKNNIEVSGLSFPSVKVGEKFGVNEDFAGAYDALQSIFSVLLEEGLRGNVSRIEYRYDKEVSDPLLRFPMFVLDCSEGMQIVINLPETNPEEKAKKAFARYKDLQKQVDPNTGNEIGDAGRLEGRIEVSGRGENIVVIYSPDPLPKRA